MEYFVECKSCGNEIQISREPAGVDSVTITGEFTTFPNCPHCGADNQYDPADIQTRTQDA